MESQPIESNTGVQEAVPDPTHLGQHVIAEFFQADFEILSDPKMLEEEMCKAALAAGATILSANTHHYAAEGDGVSSVVII